jgi:hypothetical protein
MKEYRTAEQTSQTHVSDLTRRRDMIGMCMRHVKEKVCIASEDAGGVACKEY